MKQVDKEKFYSVIGPLDVCIFCDDFGIALKLRHSGKEIGRRADGALLLAIHLQIGRAHV